MANTASAKGRVVRNAARAAINKNRRSRVRTFVKKVESAIADQNIEQAETALRAAQPELQRSVAKGIFKAGTVSRKISRLSARIKALKQASGAGKK